MKSQLRLCMLMFTLIAAIAQAEPVKVFASALHPGGEFNPVGTLAVEVLVEDIGVDKQVSVVYLAGSDWSSFELRPTGRTQSGLEIWSGSQWVTAPNPAASVEFAVNYNVDGQIFWDNNNGEDYQIYATDPCGTSEMTMRGTFNNWAADPMICDLNGYWEIDAASFTAAGRFKFDEFGDWNKNYGDNDGDGYAEQNGEDIQAIAGTYAVRFNVNNHRYIMIDANASQCGTHRMYLRGTFNDWAAQAMTCTDFQWVAEEVTFTKDSSAFKFDVYADWTKNYGDSGQGDRSVIAFGANITLAPGTYDIQFDFNAKTYRIVRSGQPCGTPSMFLRGTFNEWESREMTCRSDGMWIVDDVIFELSQSDEPRFKFDVYGDWTENYGDNEGDGTSEAGGEDIAVNEGRYFIRFDYINGEYGIFEK